ncbi:hypothetical protein C9374_005868 [Naegleria lovaniensis]|uniref:Uncharacterized protein n=1 Tax=Naegleria lovaniensis TaxID=51637 RepID=A0AA88GMT7_NAELO|nr:uncharacterized protein C9374_005868 [Naegleria lovaniensis]KAG2382076.1 hypothetical protein C9374_005868 [Naegleria lovaniensis]
MKLLNNKRRRGFYNSTAFYMRDQSSQLTSTTTTTTTTSSTSGLSNNNSISIEGTISSSSDDVTSSSSMLLKKRKIKYGISRVRTKLLRNRLYWESQEEEYQQQQHNTQHNPTPSSSRNQPTAHMCSNNFTAHQSLPNCSFTTTNNHTCSHLTPSSSSSSLQDQLHQVLLQVLSQMTLEQFQDQLALAVSRLFESLLRAKEILEQRQAIQMSEEEKQRFTREVLSSSEFQSKISSIQSIFHFESILKEDKELFIMVSNVIPQQRSVYVASFMKNQPDQ